MFDPPENVDFWPNSGQGSGGSNKYSLGGPRFRGGIEQLSLFLDICVFRVFSLMFAACYDVVLHMSTVGGSSFDNLGLDICFSGFHT